MVEALWARAALQLAIITILYAQRRRESCAQGSRSHAQRAAGQNRAHMQVAPAMLRATSRGILGRAAADMRGLFIGFLRSRFHSLAGDTSAASRAVIIPSLIAFDCVDIRSEQ
jgi:hypothetical protein